MFHSMSENPPHRVGKIFSHLSVWGKSTTFEPGRADWNLPKISDTQRRFVVSTFFHHNSHRTMAPNRESNRSRIKRQLSRSGLRKFTTRHSPRGVSKNLQMILRESDLSRTGLNYLRLIMTWEQRKCLIRAQS